jgi:hypothetical protein
MDPTAQDNQRRSSRVFIKLPVHVSGKTKDGRAFREMTETVVVNAHGGLLYLNAPVTMDAMLTLTSPVTSEEQECRVVFFGTASDKGTRVGVEFLSPAPRFWGVEFPPTDWPPVTATASGAD